MGKKRGGGVRVKQVGPKAPPAMPSMEDFAIPPEEMVNLPPTPDRSYQIIWPIHESFSMKTEGFRVIYPSYLDSTKSCKEGRRLAKEKSVPTPTCSDISLALQSMQVRHVLQPYKGYSRDITCLWDNPGRVLVDTSQFTKTELMEQMAERIPDLPARKNRLEQQAAAAEKEEQERKIRAQKEKAAASAASTKSTATGNKKKGKKGKRK
mmetsp:Transcript_24064/g.66737  ORF Transcript_24064/g.66737 Transcript_24064/m.66737 type:complete len:208 (-) Transcript_24064:29-652(-)|eukprot:CAMPEP_0168743818 /NCGR_PEP_ID=MMETSP0724-20121128/13774_1 /TAXON_ID=265536 /ORGANISM="Amphiprora sp., Strain CCMP467" /LENGTH=207 /DNA_ID=CAMNT_0008791463 /DNA_START=108 /DNA_END=731 /DNA_ORIENTATION=+